MAAKQIPTQEGDQPDGTTWKLIDGKMRLISRRPEWPEQDARDREAYGLPQNQSLPVNVFLEVHPDESPEHGYRRGYGDGWRFALDTFMELLSEGLTPQEAFNAMYRFGVRGPIREWIGGDCRSMKLAPHLPTMSAAREIKEQRKQQKREDE